MKKKLNVLLVSSLITVGAISSAALVSCGNKKNDTPIVDVEDTKTNFTIKNDNSIGTVVVTDLDGNVLDDTATFDKEILVKVTVTNEKYILKEVSVGNMVLMFDETHQAYKFNVPKETFEIKVKYEKTIVYKTLKVDTTSVKGIEEVKVYLNHNKTPEILSSEYTIATESDVALDVKTNDVTQLKTLKINNEVITKNEKSGLYEFKMPENDVVVTFETVSLIAVQYDVDEFATLKVVQGETTSETLPETLQIGETITFKGTVQEGHKLDLDQTGVMNLDDRIKLDSEYVDIKVEGLNFEIKIKEVINKRLKIKVITKLPGIYEGKPFVGKWTSIASTDLATAPILSIAEDSSATLNLYSGTTIDPATSTLITDEDGNLSGEFKVSNKTYTARIILLHDTNGALFGLFVNLEGFSQINFLAVKDTAKYSATITHYSFNNQERNLTLLNVNNGDITIWFDITLDGIKDIKVLTEDKITETNIIEKDKVYFIKDGEQFTEFKYIDYRIVSASSEQGVYKNADKDDLILDGYGNFTLGEKTGNYVYIPKQNLLTLTISNQETIKLSIDINLKTYFDYVAILNELSGMVYKFSSLETNTTYGTLFTFKFIDAITVHVEDSSKSQINDDCIYELDGQEVTFYLPLACAGKNGRIIKGTFNSTFTTLSFHDSYFCGSGDADNLVVNVTALNGEFKNADTTNSDILHITTEGYKLNSDTNYIKYTLSVGSDGSILIRSSNALYVVNTKENTYTLGKPSSNAWLSGKVFGGKFVDESNSEYNIDYTCTFEFDSTKPNTFKTFYVKREVKSFDPSYNFENNTINLKDVKYEFNSNTSILTLSINGNIVRILADEKNETIQFKSNFTNEGRVYYINGNIFKAVAPAEQQ